MPADETIQSDQNEVQSDIETPETSEVSSDQISSDIERRLQATALEAKKYRQKNAELNLKLSKFEQDKLTESGKWQDAYEKAQTELDSERKKAEGLTSKYAFKVVRSQLAERALKMGCDKTSDLADLMATRGMLDDLQIDENFNVDESTMKIALDRAKKDFYYLFGTKAPSIKDVVPRSTETSEDVTKLPLEVQKRKLAELLSGNKN